jgi:hypothetical protein
MSWLRTMGNEGWETKSLLPSSKISNLTFFYGNHGSFSSMIYDNWPTNLEHLPFTGCSQHPRYKGAKVAIISDQLTCPKNNPLRWCFQSQVFNFSTFGGCETSHDIISFSYYWLVVEPPLWKIWVRQLGLWHSQYDGKKSSIHVPNHQQDYHYIPPVMESTMFTHKK